tara:strand:- start:360 stop:569 length:210 start_codon:yes stop_codon:yes gene_type:complete
MLDAGKFLLAICDPAEVSALEFLFGDDAYELFGVSCCDSFTDDDSEVIDDELLEDCKGSATQKANLRRF